MRFLDSVLRSGRSKCHFLALENGHFWQKCLFSSARILFFYGYMMNNGDFHLFPQMTRNHIIVVQDDDVESMLKGMRNSLPTPLTGKRSGDFN